MNSSRLALGQGDIVVRPRTALGDSHGNTGSLALGEHSTPSSPSFSTSALPPVHVQSHDRAVIKVPLRFGQNSFKTLTLMSYNVENLFDTTPPGVSEVQSSKSAQSIQSLGAVIRRENPDILAVQEVENTRILEWLNRKELENKYNVICSPKSSDPRGIRTGILYKKDIELVDWKIHSPKDAKNNPLMIRDVLQGTFLVKTPDGCKQEVVVLSAHFKAMRGGEARTTPQRVKEAKATAAIIQDLLKENPKRNIVLMGDLNFKADNKYGKQVMDALLTPTGAPNITEIFSPVVPAPPTHRYQKQDNKLDYIFVSNPLFRDKVEARVSGQFGVTPWSQASDHLPPVGVVKTRCQHQVNFRGRTIPPAATAIALPEKRLSLLA